MENWGYQPCDGDGAQDKFMLIVNAAQSVLDAFFASNTDSRNAWENLGVLQLYLESGFPVKVSTLVRARRFAEKLVEDKDFHKQWEEPEAFVKCLKVFSSVLQELIGKDDEILTLEGDLFRTKFFEAELLNEMSNALELANKRRKASESLKRGDKDDSTSRRS